MNAPVEFGVKSKSSAEAIMTTIKAKLLICLALSLCGYQLSSARTALSSNEVVGVRLTGHASWNGQSWPFEIVMEGYDRYYRKETYPKPTNNILQSKSFTAVGIWCAVDDAGDSKDRGYVARRLWRGDRFCGIVRDELRDLVEYGHYTEAFTTTIALDHFPIPCVLKWTDNTAADHRVITYTIETVTFTNRSDPQFWMELRRKNFALADLRSDPSPVWHEQLSAAQLIATNALRKARQDPTSAVAKLRSAMDQFPLDNPRGAQSQSALLGALWQIRGLQVKQELVDWLYRTLPHARNPAKSANGVLDHGPLCLLFAIDSAKQPGNAQFLRAVIADPRFEQTDAVTVVLLMEMCQEGFPVPDGVDLGIVGTDDNKEIPKQLLPVWRNMLRRHFGLPEA